MAQTINYFSKAAGVTPAANHNSGTPQPFQGSKPALTQQTVGIPIFAKSDYFFAAGVDPLLINDIYVSACLPKDHELVDAYIEVGNGVPGGPFTAAGIDTGATLTLTLAQLLQDFTNIVAGTELIIASTVGQAGGVARASNVPGIVQASQSVDLWYGLKIVAAPAGLTAGAMCRVVLVYVPTETYNPVMPAALFP